MKSGKRKVNKKKVRKFILILVLIVVLLFIAIWQGKQLLFPEKVAQTVKVVDKIDEYGYSLNENETEYYKSLFKKLKKELSKESYDEEKYASLISQLFLADFYSLNNSINKNDVGGMQYVYEPFQSDFVNLAKESVYSTVENNIYGDRKQKLPTVSEVVVNEIRQESYEYGEKTDETAYTIDLTIKYKEDMGYQEDATLNIIHTDKKLEIVEMK
ncbi:MAG: hypothetical protein IJ134_00140 [Bacilli bacterium]|nr:hypothetical protein [Bacilli bacterium]